MKKQDIIKKYPFLCDSDITGVTYLRYDTNEYEIIEIFDRSINSHKTFIFSYSCGYFSDMEKYNKDAKQVTLDIFGLKVFDFDEMKITNF